jgi:hypothetical protein
MLGLLLGAAWGWLATPGLHEGSSETNLPKAVHTALEKQGLDGKVEDLRFVDPPRPSRILDLKGHRFVGLLHRNHEDDDVWLGYARLTPEGRLLEISSLYNLSDTSAVGESALTVNGSRVAWTVEDEGLALSVHVANLTGVSLADQKDFSAFDRLKTRITFLQETGQTKGIAERVFRLEPPRRSLALSWVNETIALADGKERTLVAPTEPPQGTITVKEEPFAIGHPGGLVTWGVDRIRALPWFGSDRMQFVKTIAFSLLDYSSRVKSEMVDRDGSGELKALLGDTIALHPQQAPDPNTGWPPPPLESRLKPALPGEGAFSALDQDPFAVPEEGGASPFAFTYLRTDPSRPHSQVFIVAWDPRRIELHTMTGTREPKTATGETGPGQVPRTKERVGRLAAAFNGGFQATHGEFGMMADRVVYLPPKPYAATIAELDDGTTGFGTWPDDDAIGNEYVGFRQNLTPLLSDGKDNPYKRNWWGGVPPGWQDATRTVRTGLCLTKDHYVAYFYGSSIDSDHLTLAMNSAQCIYGVHLDMNPGHTGLEFYRIGEHDALPTLSRKLDSTWEVTGSVSNLPGIDFLGRRMIRSMHLMNFPRYVRTDSRDFFYLTHRQLLTRERLAHLHATLQPKGLTWQTSGLPHHGFPPALALAKYSPEKSRPNTTVSVVLLDGKWAKPTKNPGNATSTILTSKIPPTQGEASAVYVHRSFQIVPQSSLSNATEAAAKGTEKEALPVVIATGQTKIHASTVRAGVGITDGQWLYYVEVTQGADPAHDVSLISRVLEDFGCTAMVFLEKPLALTIGETKNPKDDDAVATERLTWQRDDTPFARRILEKTPIVPLTVWHPLQEKRVRYKRQQRVSATTSPDEPAELPPEGPTPPSNGDPEPATTPESDSAP